MQRALRLLPALVLVSSVMFAGPAHAADATKNPFQYQGRGEFQTPSHNIACGQTGEMLRCDIADHTWKPPLPKPEWCPEADWGHGVYVAFQGDTGMICSAGPDEIFIDPSLRVLDYGATEQIGAFTCSSTDDSSDDGPGEMMYCFEGETGHGFMLSNSFYGFF